MTNIEPEELSAEVIAQLASGTSKSIFAKIGRESGVIDSPLKAGIKLETEAVVNRLLHIETVNITRAVDEQGVVSDFPVVAFSEYPGHYYLTGKRMNDVVTAWATAAGDDFDYSTGGFVGDRMLPKLNQLFLSEGNPAVVFYWKTGRKNKYVDVLVV